FYTYFKDKYDVVNVLGRTVYADLLQVIGQWDDIPKPCVLDDVEAWVRDYFAFLDVNGAFILSASRAAPLDEDFRASARRMTMRVAFLLGTTLRSRQAKPTDAPEALGLSTIACLDNSWAYLRVQRLPVDEDDMVRTLSETILHSLNDPS